MHLIGQMVKFFEFAQFLRHLTIDFNCGLMGSTVMFLVEKRKLLFDLSAASNMPCFKSVLKLARPLVKDMNLGYFFYSFNLLSEGPHFMNVKIMILMIMMTLPVE